MDDERLRQGGSVLSERYFEEQLQRVREIRLSKRKFYQKIDLPAGRLTSRCSGLVTTSRTVSCRDDSRPDCPGTS